jgi:hypothetical protein
MAKDKICPQLVMFAPISSKIVFYGFCTIGVIVIAKSYFGSVEFIPLFSAPPSEN